jgi:uncharacterized membrane protein YoaK (UPF0700 family)
LSGAAVILLGATLATSAPNPFTIPAAVVCTAFAMGIQSESVQHLGISGITGNVVTSTLVTAIKRLVNCLRPSESGDPTQMESPRHVGQGVWRAA